MPANQDNLPPLQPTWGDWFGCVWSAGSCWFMAGMFVTAWWWPRALDNGRWVKLGVGVLVLEFILIHAGGFINLYGAQKAGWARTSRLIALTAFYAVFGVAFAIAFQSWWILGSFALVMTGRLWSVFAGQTDMDQAISRRRIVASVMLYLVLVFATVFMPLPRGGITEPLLNEVWPTRKSGVWERHPERALAMGAAYFLLLGWVERRPPRKLLPPFQAV